MMAEQPSEFEVGPGSVIRLRYFETYSDDGSARLGFTARKGTVFACLILGMEAQPYPTPGEPPSRADRMLEGLGWQMQRDPAAGMAAPEVTPELKRRYLNDVLFYNLVNLLAGSIRDWMRGGNLTMEDMRGAVTLALAEVAEDTARDQAERRTDAET